MYSLPNHEAIKKINSMFYAFLWNGKGDKVKRKIMINDYTNGGLKMLDVASFNEANGNVSSISNLKNSEVMHCQKEILI